MKINYNVSALVANSALSVNEKKFNVSTERLSTGYKINHAKDNPSGIAIAKRMNAQIDGLTNANQNASNAISVVSSAEGALSEMQAMVQRMNELAISAANGPKTDDDRKAIQEEIKQLKDELTRMMNDTEFNGKHLLNGDCDLKGYSDKAGVKVNYYADEVPVGHYKFTVNSVAKDDDGNLLDGAVTLLQDDSDEAFPADATISYDKDHVTVTASDNFQMIIKLTDDAPVGEEVDLDITGIGAMRVQIGANEGQVLGIRIPKVSLEAMGIEDADVSTIENAQKTIEYTRQANAFISSVRSRIGAYENRLNHTQTSINITSENMTGAYSRIMDVDMAEEMTDYSNLQVLNQAGISVLTQANQRPSEMLQLLQ